MPNEKIADLISTRLPAGLNYPTEDGKIGHLVLPPFRTAGMPEQITEQVTTTTALLGKAIIHLIETDGRTELVDRDELEHLRTRVAMIDGQDIGAITEECRHCGTTLHKVRPTAKGKATVDGPALIQSFAKRSAQCPHEVTN